VLNGEFGYYFVKGFQEGYSAKSAASDIDVAAGAMPSRVAAVIAGVPVQVEAPAAGHAAGSLSLEPLVSVSTPTSTHLRWKAAATCKHLLAYNLEWSMVSDSVIRARTPLGALFVGFTCAFCSPHDSLGFVGTCLTTNLGWRAPMSRLA
jgi:hypothetical protein